ncbi:MAG: hypothetical protein DHS20C16_25310 [Phycisphaerae bacterium]|nr:MAG: hypothetical protein DHS20C16_25310 [Phycisphaerae bacterium]
MPDRIDQFESVFKAAEKARYHYDPPLLDRVVVLVDTPKADSSAYVETVRAFLKTSNIEPDNFQILGSEDFTGIQQMLATVHTASPNLIITHRHLHLNREELEHSLGTYLDTLLQGTNIPVLVTPSPEADGSLKPLEVAHDVLVMTDHLIDDPKSINYGVRFVARGGSVHLCHIEDDAVFQKYIALIERIPEIETDVAREKLRAKLLQLPSDYIASCIDALKSETIDARINPIVRLGHRVTDYHQLIDEHEGDLLVCNTSDPEDLAIHPMAYAIALEFRNQPLLLL